MIVSIWWRRWSFGPGAYSVISDVTREGDSSCHVYLTNVDGTSIRRMHDRGDHACSFIFPNGKRLM
jgi:hypothetical protein